MNTMNPDEDERWIGPRERGTHSGIHPFILVTLIVSTACMCAAKPVPDGLNGPAVLSKDQAEGFRDRMATEILAELGEERAAEVEGKSISAGDKVLRWLEKDFNLAPEGQRSLWISMHGGGGAPAAVNDRQWQNQITLYQPQEGIYVAPRAPTNSWNLWHERHIDPLFDRLIADMVAVRGVDPDRVYLMGYSAGGDGVWQLAPRMADRFAAAAMMAGHPNEASLLPLRNLPFAIFMGAADAAYDRNKIAATRGEELAALHKADPRGYEHRVRIYDGLPHWMNGRDKEAVPWMARHVRNPWPKKVVWVQDDVTHDRFYWLEIPAGTAKAGQKVVATVDGNTISLDGDVADATVLHLSDSLVDLDQPVTVRINGEEAFSGKVTRSAAVIEKNLRALPDAPRCGFAVLKVGLK
jgi:pimeloyl-ACP methyl ester carboxylesterase